mgnify:CR=1 FL=1
MACIEESLSTVALDGGKLIIYSNGIKISNINVPMPNLSAEKSRDSTVEDEEYFNDDFGNEYVINVYSSIYGIDYSIETIHTEDESKAKEFCNSLTVEFQYFEINPYENKEDFEDTQKEETKFFTIKSSQEQGIRILSDFFHDKNTHDIFLFDGLTQLYNDVKIGSLIFVVAGGDKAKMNFEYIQGLYGVARVIKAPYDKNGKSYKIGLKFIYFFNKVITQKDLYKYEDTINIPNIGVTVGKGEQNQAISRIETKQAKAIILAATDITKISNSTLFNLFPWAKDKYRTIATENYKSIIDTLPPALNVVSIASVFANYLMNYNSKYTTTLIGIFGMWGRGKTYFFDKVKEYIISKNTDEKTFYFSKFQAWKYQKLESAWAYLYQTILESYLQKDTKNTKFLTQYKWYKILLLNIKRLGFFRLAFPLLSIILTAVWIFFIPFEYKFNTFCLIIGTIGVSGVILIFKSYLFYMESKHTAKKILDLYGKTNDYSNYLGFQSEIEKELSFLLQIYIDVNKEKLVLFIDDLDRCKEEIIIDIVDGLKLVLDNEEINSRLIVVTAIDERVLEKSIRHKYLNNDLPENVGTKEYIEKFFLMGIKLNQLNDSDIDELVDIYTHKLNHKLYEAEEEPIDYNNEDNELVADEISGDIIREIGSDGFPPLIVQSNNGDVKPLFVNNHLNMNSFVLDDYEIAYIKEVLKKVGLLTPRKINMFIQRYLIFKSLVLTILNDTQYESFHSKMLIEIVIMSQNKDNLDSFREHYITHTDYVIPIPLDDFETDKINRDEYIILIKFAEMVSPF